MLIGQTIVCDPNNVETVVYTAAFPRQGDGITSVAEVMRLPTATTLTIQPQHVNSEDMELSSAPGWTDIGAPITFNAEIKITTAEANKVKNIETTALKEVLRYKITLKTSDANVKSFAHFRVLNPSWQTSGAQTI